MDVAKRNSSAEAPDAAASKSKKRAYGDQVITRVRTKLAVEEFKRMVIYVLIHVELSVTAKSRGMVRGVRNGVVLTINGYKMSSSEDCVDINDRADGDANSGGKGWLYHPHTSLLVGSVSIALVPVDQGTLVTMPPDAQSEEQLDLSNVEAE